MTDKWTLAEVDDLPDYEDGHEVSCLLNVRKQIGGVPEEFTLRVHHGVEELLGHTLNIPSLTQPSRGFHNGGSQSWEWSTIFDTLSATMRNYIFFIETAHYDIVALAAMSSYFREVFNTFPYMDFYSQEVDCGKSTAMRALVWSSYYGDLMTCPTPAVVYRVIDESHCTLGIDEIDNAMKGKNSEIRGFLLSVLNSGYMKGIPAKRCDPNTQKVVSFDAFGLKSFTRVSEIDRALESRSITIPMIRSPAGNVLQELDSAEPFREIRDHLYRARFEHMDDVRDAYLYVLQNCRLQNRARQLFIPLLTMAHLVGPDVYERALRFAEDFTEQRKGDTDNEFARVLVGVLLNPAYIGHEVPLKNVTDEFNKALQDKQMIEADHAFQGRRVSKMLQGLGLRKTGKRTDGYVYYLVNSQIVEEWARRYQFKDTPDSASLSSLSSFDEPNEPESGKEDSLENEDMTSHPQPDNGSETAQAAKEIAPTSAQFSEPTNEDNEANEDESRVPKGIAYEIPPTYSVKKYILSETVFDKELAESRVLSFGDVVELVRVRWPKIPERRVRSALDDLMGRHLEQVSPGVFKRVV